MTEDPGVDIVPWDYKILIAVMERHIVGTLSKLQALVSEIISMARALREEISDQMTEVGV